MLDIKKYYEIKLMIHRSLDKFYNNKQGGNLLCLVSTNICDCFYNWEYFNTDCP